MSTVHKITHLWCFFKTKFDVGSEILYHSKNKFKKIALVSQVLPLPKAGTRVYQVETKM
jgi:hypothetical protein